MKRALLVPLLALSACLLAACDEKSADPLPDAREFTSGSVAAFCGMSLAEHPGPKAQIFVKGRAEPVWFASVHDMFAYTLLPEEPKAIRAIYVNDMGAVRDWDHPEPGTWVDARRAVFVIGSRKRGGMDEDEAVPFAVEAQARAFVARNGGRLVRFAEMPADYVLPRSEATPSPGARG
jgi:copper chaperone NosL